MYVARILYPVQVLGPGNRIGIWFNGCEHGCRNCSNPELWKPDDRYQVKTETVKKLILQVMEMYTVDGFTITGGDPFYQPEALNELLSWLREFPVDILVYTGYEYQEIAEKYSEILTKIDVLIDGKYIEERNAGEILRGSDNQHIYYLNPDMEKIYEEYRRRPGNQIQNFRSKDGVISVGIHLPGYMDDLNAALESKGIKVKHNE